MRLNPTVVLFGGVVTGFAALLTLAIRRPDMGWAGAAVLFVAQAMLFFPAYTVAHDAAHHIASRNRMLNEIMLLTCGVIFLFEPYLFRRLHLTHHAHTDDDDDPDLFSAGRNWAIRAVRSGLLLLAYYLYALRHWRGETRWRLHVMAAPLIPLVIGGAFVVTGNTIAFLIAWLGPLVVSGGVLALALSSLPHDAATRTTRNLHAPLLLRWLLGNGHLHLAHHVAPTVPWYQLPAYWRKYCDCLSPGFLIRSASDADAL